MKKYNSFFTTIIPLTESTRHLVFFTGCSMTRTLVGFLFILRSDSVGLNYISILWGMTWLAFMISRQRWIEKDDTPPWWNGVARISWRFSFDLILIMAGLIGVLDTDLREDANIITGTTVLIDLTIGVLDYIYTINK